jgi:diguanylate cyclase (GGDEF)-like protein
MFHRTQLVVFLFIAATCAMMVAAAHYLAKAEREMLTVGIAESYAVALNEMHEYYSHEIAARALLNGMEMSHDLLRDKRALPFPATFVNALGERLNSAVAGLSAGLYSEYPFQWARTRVLTEGQQAAIAFLRHNSEAAYTYRTMVNGQEVLHLARALVMKQSCVDCHNRYDFDRDVHWSAGDFRGVREISLPLTSGPSRDSRAYAVAFILILLASSAGALLVWPTVRRLNGALDLSERLSRDLEFSATHDHLTGLPNLGLGRDRLEQAIASSRRSMTKTAVLFVDLDGFKAVNDSQGHDAGDLVLVEAARRMSEAVRESDTVARIGGDEFIVVLSGLGGTDMATQAAERIVASLQRPIHVKGREAVIGSSIGIALFPDDGDDAEALLKCSDTAMYGVKRAGKNGFGYFRSAGSEG